MVASHLRGRRLQAAQKSIRKMGVSLLVALSFRIGTVGKRAARASEPRLLVSFGWWVALLVLWEAV